MNRKGSKVFTDGITTSSPEVDLDGIEDQQHLCLGVVVKVKKWL
jgi:hypothetical protein